MGVHFLFFFLLLLLLLLLFLLLLQLELELELELQLELLLLLLLAKLLRLLSRLYPSVHVRLELRATGITTSTCLQVVMIKGW